MPQAAPARRFADPTASGSTTARGMSSLPLPSDGPHGLWRRADPADLTLTTGIKKSVVSVSCCLAEGAGSQVTIPMRPAMGYRRRP